MRFWEHANHIAIPRAEREAGTVPLDPDSDIAVLGAQRSGTTWVAGALAAASNATKVTEEDALAQLMAPTHAPDLRAGRGSATLIWHLTFLAACPRLLDGVVPRVRTVVVIREPYETCWSMLHNWGSLKKVTRMVGMVHQTPTPTARVDKACFIIERTWTNLLRWADHPRVCLTLYEDLKSAPQEAFEVMGRKLELDLAEVPRPDDEIVGRRRRLSRKEQRAIPDRLFALYDRWKEASQRERALFAAR